ncbi:PAAR domain-containing protein [Massilia sp. W12]|uniref:PAAR domain-containing protein n=1 Tax=Massilia sp. W12 TaxID=3126507 RepID=UPI0030D07B41
MAQPIRLGDTTSHGGKVVSASSHSDFHGRPLALLGDACTCPLHGPGVIVSGSAHWSAQGKPVALHGHQTSCGARLLASLAQMEDCG